MNRHSARIRIFHLSPGRTALVFNLTWLAALVAGLWAIGTLFVPIFSAFFTPLETWLVAVVTMVLSVASLVGHSAAHQGAARITGSTHSGDVPLYPVGDAAQTWPPAPTAGREAVAALAGPFASLALAGLAYGVWNVQFNGYINTVSLFLFLFNGGVAVLNLAPIFPLDGGRLVRAMVWGLLARPALAAWLERVVSLLGIVLVAGWGLFLISQPVRFSGSTGASTLLLAGLLFVMLIVHPIRPWIRPTPPRPSLGSLLFLRAPLTGLIIVMMLGLTLMLVPTNNGLEAPGIATSVEPMVEVPDDYRQPVQGSFLLTTVFSQTPISVGQWLIGQFSPVIRLVPPERIVPPDTTVQEVALRNYRMLEDSEQAAAAVGLRLAGYDAQVRGLGARVLSVLPNSPSYDILQPGDVVVGVNSQPVEAVTDLTSQLARQPLDDQVVLQIERDMLPLTVTTTLMPPAEPGQPPRIGIGVEDVGFDINLPFPVEIIPQKIIGGPSAGLMFTLTVYNMVTPTDLTGGRTIAGTGTISLDGTVGPIGGVQQKVAGAEMAGAEYFLSPPENYDDAAAVARRIKVIKVATATEAIDFLRSLEK
ncbi:MAG: PDZ domain-containing protein [Anaerolineae bacterium]|nr:PDZ domain-containing protein [Anaerolineae bacterium]